MERAQNPLFALEEWTRKGSQMLEDSRDILIGAAASGFQAMTAVLDEQSPQEHIQRALSSFNLQRCMALQFDTNRYDPVRSVFHGFLECTHLTLKELMSREGNRVKESEEMFTPTVQNPTMDEMAETEANVHNEHDKHVDNVTFDAVETVAERRPKRSVSKAQKNYESTDEFDDVIESSKNESRSLKAAKKRNVSNDEESNSETDVKRPRFAKANATDLKCPECEFHTNSVQSWVKHLIRQHATTPFLAGAALRCECGHESFSESHSYICEIAKFTVVRIKDGAMDKRKTTPQRCILCNAFPKTPCGYIDHLRVHHKTTLKAHGIYLKCVCGFDICSNGKPNHKHKKECDRLEFTVHKIEEK